VGYLNIKTKALMVLIAISNYTASEQQITREQLSRLPMSV